MLTRVALSLLALASSTSALSCYYSTSQSAIASADFTKCIRIPNYSCANQEQNPFCQQSQVEAASNITIYLGGEQALCDALTTAYGASTYCCDSENCNYDLGGSVTPYNDANSILCLFSGKSTDLAGQAYIYPFASSGNICIRYNQTCGNNDPSCNAGDIQTFYKGGSVEECYLFNRNYGKENVWCCEEDSCSKNMTANNAMPGAIFTQVATTTTRRGGNFPSDAFVPVTGPAGLQALFGSLMTLVFGWFL